MGRKDKKAFGAHYRGRDTMFHVKHSLPRFWTTAVGERRRLLATWSAKLHEYVGTCRCWGVRQRGVDWTVSAGEGQSADGHDVSRGTLEGPWFGLIAKHIRPVASSISPPISCRSHFVQYRTSLRLIFKIAPGERSPCFTWNSAPATSATTPTAFSVSRGTLEGP